MEILTESQDPAYVPTEADIESYAVGWLAMDAEADKHLFWIAKEGLLAPMPPHWEPTQDANGATYYYNFVTHAV